MSLRISGKHMEIGEAFRSRIQGRIEETVQKYFDGGYSGHVTVEKSGARFSADCVIFLDTGMGLQAAGQAYDPQAAFEAASERIDTRLRRYKRKLRSYDSAPNGRDQDIAYRVMAPAAEEIEEIPEDFAPAIVAESTVALKTMSVARAIVELDVKDSPVFVFRNAGNDQVNIVYRRADGNIGWIDPSTAMSA
ncbi:MAG: ribosome-associated translation inhibitor RaiA [Pseudomonadota bacterium]|nr:ribosome-associated translation inhibitor RaiA [Pseudomonadota bacterium]